MTYTASQVQSRKEARKHGWSKCTSCGGRGGWYQRGIFAQTIGCEHCGGLGYIQPIALPAAPAHTIEDQAPDTFGTLETPTAAGREDVDLLQTPNLIERWQDAVARARAAQSPIERREWLTEAQNLCERLSDPSTICACGVAFNALTGRCEACDGQERMKEDRRAHIGETERQRDAGVPF